MIIVVVSSIYINTNPDLYKSVEERVIAINKTYESILKHIDKKLKSMTKEMIEKNISTPSTLKVVNIYTVNDTHNKIVVTCEYDSQKYNIK